MRMPGPIGETTMNHQEDSRVAATEEVGIAVLLIARGITEFLRSKWSRTRPESNVKCAKETS